MCGSLLLMARAAISRASSRLSALIFVFFLMKAPPFVVPQRVVSLRSANKTDIELSGDWTPFNPNDGYVASAYAGTFDGNGHTISGLSVNATAANQGLFGVINGATIKT